MLRRAYGLTPALKLRPSRLSSHLAIGLRQYSSEPDTRPNVAVLGGGITGLASAYYITQSRPDTRVTIYEASDKLGGWMQTKRVQVEDGSVIFESGPRTLRPSGNGVLAARMFQELGIDHDAIYPQNMSPAARNRYVYYPDHLVRMPHPSFGLSDNLWTVWTESVFKDVILSGAREFFRDPREPIEDESVGDFFSRRLSKTVVDRILSAVLHGIYAGDAWKLSAKSLFPAQWRDEITQGSVFAGMARSRADGVEMTVREADFIQEMKKFPWNPLLNATLATSTVFTLKNGLGMMVDALTRHLVANGNVEFKISSPVESVKPTEGRNTVSIKAKTSDEPENYQHVISTLPPAQLNSIHEAGKSQPTTKALVPHIPTVTVMTVNLYYRTPGMHPEGFGYLIPQATPFENNPERALGVIFDTAYSPSADDLDPTNWELQDTEQLKQARDQGQLVNVNDFAWYNLPDKPNSQDDVKHRGTKITVMLGGHWWSEWPVFPTDEEGLALAKSVVERHLGITEQPLATDVNLQKDCIPQYTVGHEQRLKTAHNNIWSEYNGRLRVAGNWINGVGVNDCLRSAWDVVGGLNEFKRTGLEHVGADQYVRVKAVRQNQKAPEE